jgi:hypothetical protein
MVSSRLIDGQVHLRYLAGFRVKRDLVNSITQKRATNLEKNF